MTVEERPEPNLCLVNSAVECLPYKEKVGSSILSQGTSFRLHTAKNLTTENRTIVGSTPTPRILRRSPNGKAVKM